MTVGIPAELLSRRPDVRAAEREAAAYAEQIGIAKAEFYPFIGITGSIGYQANEFRDLWNSPAFNGSIGPTFRWNILSYGRTVNWVRNWDAQFQEKVVTYQRQVLNANLQVENAIKDFLLNQQIVKQREISVESLKTAHDIALTKYLAGVQTYTPVSLIFQDYVTELVLLYQSRRDVADSLMRIYAALGGGWQIRLQPAETLPMTSDRASANAGQSAEELPTPDPESLQPPVDPEQPAAKPKPAAKAEAGDVP
ncbi:MAG: TolC family protein [Planctomycetota bacterium]|nr:TolC family protein [Planctomycetota bacterium]